VVPALTGRAGMKWALPSSVGKLRSAQRWGSAPLELVPLLLQGGDAGIERDTALDVFAKAVHEAFGAARMLGCTGFPEDSQRGEAVGFRVIEEEIDFLAVEDKEWILGKTADLLYGLKGD